MNVGSYNTMLLNKSSGKLMGEETTPMGTFKPVKKDFAINMAATLSFVIVDFTKKHYKY